MSKHIVCIEHDRVDGPGFIADWADLRGYDLWVVRAEDPLPPPKDINLLILLGGTASALDFTTRQLEERQLAREVAESGRPVLGFCLGAQLLAIEFGGDVLTGVASEHDWSAIDIQVEWLRDLLLDDRLLVFQAHNDIIKLSPSSTPLASSLTVPIQAFAGPGSVLGLQFHLEADTEKIAAFRQLRGRLNSVAAADEGRLARCRAALYRLLDSLLEIASQTREAPGSATGARL